MMNYILKDKKPVLCPDIHEWAKWFQTADRHIAKDTIGESSVSTVFLGLDHSFGGGIPILFETMVFGGPLDGEQERYSTWKKAEEGHLKMCERVRSEKP